MIQTKDLKKNIEYVDKKIPNTGGLVKKIDYNTKKMGIENKIFSVTGSVTTAACNTKFRENENKIPDITNLAAKAAAKIDKNRWKPQTFDLSYFWGKSHLKTMEHYLEFQLDSKYFKAPSAKSIQMIAWKPNRLSEESIKSPTTSEDSLTPLFSMLPKLKQNLMEVARNQKKKFPITKITSHLFHCKMEVNFVKI